VQWCSQENLSDWAPTPTNTAGALQIASEGLTMCAAAVSGGTLILTETEAHLLRYVGPPYVYGLNKVGDGCGPVSPHAMASTVNVTAWQGAQGFFVWDGAPRALPCDVQDWAFATLNRDRAGWVFGVPLPNFRELWWFFADDSSLENNRYILWNYAENHWSIGRMSRTAADRVGVGQQPLMAGDGKVWVHELGWLADGVTRVGDVFAESGDVTLGEGDRIMHVLGVIPDITRSGDAAEYRFITKPYPNGPESVVGPFDFDTRGDGRVDCRFSSRSVRLRVQGARDVDFGVGRMRLEVAQGGRR
jgi:hypothetical protein